MGQARPFDRSESVALGQGFVAPTPAAEPSKLLGLELLRFGAALAVLFFHYKHFARMAGMPGIARDSVPLYGVLWPLYDYGQYGVQLFWGISGYIFFWKYGEAIHSTAVGAGKFFWLRFTRLYPLHLVTLLTVVGLQAVHRQVGGMDFVYPAQSGGFFVAQLLLATDWAWPSPFSFNGPIWSISAEVAVYAAFFLLLRRFAPSARLCLGVIIAGLTLQLVGLTWVSVSCATYFFAGGLASLAPRVMRFRAGAGLIALVAICAAMGILGDRDKLPTILLLAVPCVLILLGGDWAPLSKWQRPIEAAGNLTYSSYLLHFPLQLMLAIFVAKSGIVPSLASPLFLATYLGVTLTVAALSYRLFEVPVQNWLRHRPDGVRAAA